MVVTDSPAGPVLHCEAPGGLGRRRGSRRHREGGVKNEVSQSQ